MRAIEMLREAVGGPLHGRKLRSVAEVAFQQSGDKRRRSPGIAAAPQDIQCALKNNPVEVLVARGLLGLQQPFDIQRAQRHPVELDSDDVIAQRSNRIAAGAEGQVIGSTTKASASRDRLAFGKSVGVQWLRQLARLSQLLGKLNFIHDA